MECLRCKSLRVARVSGKCSDMCCIQLGKSEVEGDYVPRDMGIGGGDYLKFSYCLDCGQIQGTFPLDLTNMESTDDEEDEDLDPNSRFPLEDE